MGRSTWIVARLPPHRTYVEPFFGSSAVFFSKSPAEYEVVNDLDQVVVNLFRVARERGAEDEAKYAEAQRRAAGTGQAGQEPEAEEATAETLAAAEAVSSEKEAETEPAAASSPLPPDLPEGVELIEYPILAALGGLLPDPQTAEARSLTMLWGFVRQALFEQKLNLARRGLHPLG